METVHDAIDRMVMQSDLRDIYHGVQIAGFATLNESLAAAANGTPTMDKGIETEFHLQLSDNSKNEESIMEVFKRYLRQNNYSLGGTNVFSSAELTDQIRANGECRPHKTIDKNFLRSPKKISDFDECSSAQFHDCSENSYCFNLRGTYTCSCRDGFVDLSENPIYPGRICSGELIGCERCNYHGTCYSFAKGEADAIDDTEAELCECFQWYAGASCQYNLKSEYLTDDQSLAKISFFGLYYFAVLLVALIALGGILFALLLICIIHTCWKQNRPHQRRRPLVPGIDILPHKTLTCHGQGKGTSTLGGDNSSKCDKRAMIDDTSSETSDDSCHLPYVAKKVSVQCAKWFISFTSIIFFQQQKQQQQSMNQPKGCKRSMMNKPTSAPPKGTAPLPPKMTSQNSNSATNTIEQKNRSLTVMIPRAKYQSQHGNIMLIDAPQLGQHHQMQKSDANQHQPNCGPESIGSTAEAKLLTYLDSNPSTSHVIFTLIVSRKRIHSRPSQFFRFAGFD